MLRFKLVRLIAALLPLTGAVLLTWLVLAFVASTPSMAQDAVEGGVVGTGTPASCTETALVTALTGAGTITFNCGANPVTITLTSQKAIASNTTINGGGKITLSGGGTTKLFWVNPGYLLSLNNITITKGTSAIGGCITVDNAKFLAINTTIQDCTGHAISFIPGYGGAIYAFKSTMGLTDTSILNNKTDLDGGGIYVYDGLATFNRVSILNNTANYTYTDSGGGLYITSTAVVTIRDSVISNNHMGYTGQGGGIASYYSTLKQYNTEVNNNRADNAAEGGGLYIDHGSVLISGGDISGNHGLYDGGGISVQNAQADLTGVSLSQNIASSNGGGLYAFQSTVNLTDVRINNNTVDSDGGGLHCYSCTGTFTRLTIDGNSAESRDGGGMLAYNSTLTLKDSTFSNNTSKYGGGIYNSESTLTLDRVTINGNKATLLGGGFYNEGSADFTNATLSGNSAPTGGAFENKPFGSTPANLNLTNVTIKNNSATDGGGVFIVNDALSTVNIKNTIIADSLSGGNCKGKNISSAKYSISSDGTCILSGTGNYTNLDPLLTFLADNGGFTMTILPKIGSPAIDGVTGSDCPSFDQRGVSRPQGASCDIGAVERASNDPPNPRGVYLPTILK